MLASCFPLPLPLPLPLPVPTSCQINQLSSHEIGRRARARARAGAGAGAGVCGLKPGWSGSSFIRRSRGRRVVFLGARRPGK